MRRRKKGIKKSWTIQTITMKFHVLTNGAKCWTDWLHGKIESLFHRLQCFIFLFSIFVSVFFLVWRWLRVDLSSAIEMFFRWFNFLFSTSLLLFHVTLTDFDKQICFIHYVSLTFFSFFFFLATMKPTSFEVKNAKRCAQRFALSLPFVCFQKFLIRQHEWSKLEKFFFTMFGGEEQGLKIATYDIFAPIKYPSFLINRIMLYIIKQKKKFYALHRWRLEFVWG